MDAVTVKCLILSDVHASSSPSADTYISTSLSAQRVTRNPMYDLEAWVERNDLSLDLILVPGDIADQANGEGLNYAWERIQRLAEATGAAVVAAPGNHDLVTHVESDDPRGLLKDLSPPFPHQDRNICAEFWSNGVALIEGSTWRVLLVDSTYDFPVWPALGDADPHWPDYLNALNRGGFTAEQESIAESIIQSLDHKVNICLLHHHPLEHQMRHFLQDDYGSMRRGGDLVDLLTRHPDTGRWLVVHGHKHIPQLVNATAASSNGPSVLCAASLGGQLWPPVSTTSSNQFHVVTAQCDTANPVNLLTGTVESYMWSAGEGWVHPPAVGGGLPPSAGFGCGQDVRIIAKRVVELVEHTDAGLARWDTVVEHVPEVSYLLPADFESLRSTLEQSAVYLTSNRSGRIVEAAKG